MRSIVGVGITPPNVLDTPYPASSVMISRTFGAPFGGTMRGGHDGTEPCMVCLITPPNFGDGFGSCDGSAVVVALGAPGLPVRCGAGAVAAPALLTSVAFDVVGAGGLSDGCALQAARASAHAHASRKGRLCSNICLLLRPVPANGDPRRWLRRRSPSHHFTAGRDRVCSRERRYSGTVLGSLEAIANYATGALSIPAQPGVDLANLRGCTRGRKARARRFGHRPCTRAVGGNLDE